MLDVAIFEYCVKFPPQDESRNYASSDEKRIFHAW